MLVLSFSFKILQPIFFLFLDDADELLVKRINGFLQLVDSVDAFGMMVFPLHFLKFPTKLMENIGWRKLETIKIETCIFWLKNDGESRKYLLDD